MREAPAAKPGAGLSRWQRRALAAGGVAALLAVALALFAELRDSGSYDHIVLTLPQSGEQARNTAPAPAPLAARNGPQAGTADPANQAPADGGALADDTANAPAAGEAASPALAPAAPRAPSSSAAASAAAPGSATYRLQIQPWGVVYVDGIDRGVSPPIKRLVLPPGRHTVRIANPNFRERVLEVDTKDGNAQISADFNDEPRQIRTNP
jgi:hypothetical protein